MKEFWNKNDNFFQKNVQTTKMLNMKKELYIEQIYKEHFLQTYHGLIYTSTLPDVKEESLRKKKVFLKNEINGT